MFLSKLFRFFFWLIDTFFGLVFGQKYKRLIEKANKVYLYSRKVFAIDETKAENTRNDIYSRLDTLRGTVAELQNKKVSLERPVDGLVEKQEKKAAIAPRAPSPPPPPPSIPAPPPLPPTPIFTCPAPPMFQRSDDKLVLKAVRICPPEEEPGTLAPKRSKPSTVDLIKGKEKLRSTTVKRSPGGTPMSGWQFTEIDITSPEDAALDLLMKKALKRKFMNFRPFSPPSPIQASDGEDFSF